jgi:hypothetical protein
MLHGYTQSGPVFRAKSGAVAKHIQKFFSQYNVSFSYPTGPMRLAVSDIPGQTTSFATTSTSPAANSVVDEFDDNTIEAYGWWRRSDAVDPPEYRGLELGMATIADVIRREGPFDGVMGFSQGASAAAMVASVLEGSDRKSAFTKHAEESEFGIEYPKSIDGVVWRQDHPSPLQRQPPLKFAVCYSGFVAPGPRYAAFYDHPKIKTPILHVIGSLDAVVDESRTRALVDACEGDFEEKQRDGRILTHPGGHFLPSQKVYLDAVVGFIKKCLEGKYSYDGNPAGTNTKDERVEDMDVPF